MTSLFVSSTRKVVLGRASLTTPSTSIASSLAIVSPNKTLNSLDMETETVNCPSSDSGELMLLLTPVTSESLFPGIYPALQRSLQETKQEGFPCLFFIVRKRKKRCFRSRRYEHLTMRLPKKREEKHFCLSSLHISGFYYLYLMTVP